MLAISTTFDVVERTSKDNNKTLQRTSNNTRCLNLGSYNYLGFAAADEYCTTRVIESLKKYSASTCSVRVDGGTTKLHNELEELPARFVGKPAAILFGMCYVTNSAIIPCLIGKEIIQHLKHSCPPHLYATSMSPPGVQHVISAIKVILGEDGSNRGAQKLARIRENSNFFRSELKKMGFEVLGDNDSPVMPIMLYNPAKIPAFSRECLRQKQSWRPCGHQIFHAEPPKIAGAGHDKLE
uniref:serine C-palmitoyltransferase n=1 Tax=Zea mays TaxID=4577 RepID=A0A804MH72_MAIZE